MKNTPFTPVVVICATVVISIAIGALAYLVAIGADQESLTLLIGLVGTLVTALIGLARTEQIKGTVDDLSNGKMDAKIRAGVAEVLAPHMIDPGAEDQLRDDFKRRNEGYQ